MLNSDIYTLDVQNKALQGELEAQIYMLHAGVILPVGGFYQMTSTPPEKRERFSTVIAKMEAFGMLVGNPYFMNATQAAAFAMQPQRLPGREEKQAA